MTECLRLSGNAFAACYYVGNPPTSGELFLASSCLPFLAALPVSQEFHSTLLAFHIIQVNLTGIKVLDLIQTIQQLNIEVMSFIFSMHQISPYTDVNRYQQCVETCAGRHLCKR